jgi:hypothetical protein
MDHETNNQEPSSKEGGEVKVGGETSCPSLAIGQQVKVVCPRHAYDGKRGTIIGFSGIKEGEAVYEVQIEGEAIAAGLRRSSLVKVEAACGDIQVGDKVWVLCHLREVLPDRTCKVEGSQGASFWTAIDACRPVEPANPPRILDSSSEPTPEPSKRSPIGHYCDAESIWVDEPNPFEGRIEKNVGKSSVSGLVEGLSQAMQNDQDLAWTWHCNIAAVSIDEGVDHETANLAAARFMSIAFGVDVTTFEEWSTFGWAVCRKIETPSPEIPDSSSEPTNPSHYKQFVIATDNDGNQTLYVDGVLRDGDNTVYGCDVADAANGCAIKIELRDVDFIVEHWPLRLNDLGVEAKQPETNPLAPSPCMDGVNVDDFVDGTMEAKEQASDPVIVGYVQVGDAVRFVSPGHRHHGAQGLITRFTRGLKPERDYLFQSDCGQFGRWCNIAELEPVDKAIAIYVMGSMQSLDGTDTIQAGDLQWTDWDGKYRMCNFTIGMRVDQAIQRGKDNGQKWLFYRRIGGEA